MKIMTISTVLCFWLSVSIGQNEFVSGGGDAQSEKGSLSFTVGQSFYLPLTSDSYLLSPGTQQAYSITTVSSSEAPPWDLELELFPNPTSDFLILKQGNAAKENLHYTLFNLEGVPVAKGTFELDELRLSLHHLVASSYLLQIRNDHNQTQSYQIIKL